MESKYSSLSSAVWWKKKKIYSSDIQRYLDHGSKVSFTLKQQTSRNAEFIVNDNPLHIIWYSQLAGPFILIDGFTPYSGEFIKKDGSSINIYEMNVDEFVNYVNGKTFKVSVNPDGEVVKFDFDNLPEGISYDDAHKKVAQLVQATDFEGAANYLLPATQYNLIEL